MKRIRPPSRLLFEGSLIDRTRNLSEIAQRHAAQVKELEPRYRALRRRLLPGRTQGKRSNSETSEFIALHRQISDAALIGTVFAAMALESCLYSMIFQIRRDPMSLLLNEARLPALDRWRVLLWRLTGEELKSSEDLYLSLKRLIRARDSIVHSKPTVVTQESLRKLRSFDLVAEAKHAIETLEQFERYVRRFQINLAYTLLGI